MTTIATRSDQQSVRPLTILVPLIKEALVAAEEAAERAREPHFLIVADLLAEARPQFSSFSEFASWGNRHFKLRETQLKAHLSLGRQRTNYGAAAPQPSTLEEHFRSIGRNRPTSGRVIRDWTAPVDGIAEKAREQAARLAQEELSRAEERKAEQVLGRQLIDIGYKVLAKELHPDKGGSREAMARLNRVRARLHKVYP